jgi:hypothetical protein
VSVDRRAGRTRHALLATLLLTGCATADVPRPERMRPPLAPSPSTQLAIDGTPLRQQSVSLLVNPLGIFSEIYTSAFRQAARETLVASEIFAEVARPGLTHLQLDVVLGDVLWPGSYGSTAELTVLWTLTDRQGRIRWQSLVGSSFTPETKGALRVADHARVALEGAARENIRLALERLAAAEF